MPIKGSLKGDLINDAYSKMRISGLTVQAGSEDNVLALYRLENMAHELSAKNICTGYNFQDEPDPNEPHNMERQFWDSYAASLAFWLCSDFGKLPPQTLMVNHSKAYSFLSSVTASPRQTDYPTRQPVGSGNERYGRRYRHFFSPVVEAPNTCASITMAIDDIEDFTEHFESILGTGETVASYTLEASTGLTIVSQSLTSPDVDYRVRADGGSDGSNSEFRQVKIVATTSDGRIDTRVINFTLVKVEIV